MNICLKTTIPSNLLRAGFVSCQSLIIISCGSSTSSENLEYVPGGHAISRRIGGDPHEAAIHINGLYACAGAIVGKNSLYTARHCVSPFLSDYTGSSPMFRIQAYSAAVKNASDKEFTPVGYTVIGVERVYDKADLIVLKIDRPVTEIDWMARACRGSGSNVRNDTVAIVPPPTDLRARVAMNGSVGNLAKYEPKTGLVFYRYNTIVGMSGTPLYWARELGNRDDWTSCPTNSLFAIHLGYCDNCLGDGQKYNMGIALADREKVQLPIFDFEGNVTTIWEHKQEFNEAAKYAHEYNTFAENKCKSGTCSKWMKSEAKRLSEYAARHSVAAGGRVIGAVLELPVNPVGPAVEWFGKYFLGRDGVVEHLLESTEAPFKKMSAPEDYLKEKADEINKRHRQTGVQLDPRNGGSLSNERNPDLDDPWRNLPVYPLNPSVKAVPESSALGYYSDIYARGLVAKVPGLNQLTYTMLAISAILDNWHVAASGGTHLSEDYKRSFPEKLFGKDGKGGMGVEKVATEVMLNAAVIKACGPEKSSSQYTVKNGKCQPL